MTSNVIKYYQKQSILGLTLPSPLSRRIIPETDKTIASTLNSSSMDKTSGSKDNIISKKNIDPIPSFKTPNTTKVTEKSNPVKIPNEQDPLNFEDENDKERPKSQRKRNISELKSMHDEEDYFNFEEEENTMSKRQRNISSKENQATNSSKYDNEDFFNFEEEENNKNRKQKNVSSKENKNHASNTSKFIEDDDDIFNFEEVESDRFNAKNKRKRGESNEESGNATKRAKTNETLTGQSTTHVQSQYISSPNTSTKNCEIGALQMKSKKNCIKESINIEWQIKKGEWNSKSIVNNSTSSNDVPQVKKEPIDEELAKSFVILEVRPLLKKSEPNNPSNINDHNGNIKNMKMFKKQVINQKEDISPISCNITVDADISVKTVEGVIASKVNDDVVASGSRTSRTQENEEDFWNFESEEVEKKSRKRKR